MSIKIIFITTVSLLFAVPTFAQTDCLALATETNLRCDSFGTNYSLANDQGRCGYMGADSICCCKQTKVSKIQPKYIIMGAATIVLGAISIVSFALKKRELE